MMFVPAQCWTVVPADYILLEESVSEKKKIQAITWSVSVDMWQLWHEQYLAKSLSRHKHFIITHQQKHISQSHLFNEAKLK